MEIEPVGMFATPDDMKSFQDYLGLFNGPEGIAANTGAWMAWNLASKYQKEERAATELLYKACEKALALIKNTWIEEHGNPEVGMAWGALHDALETNKQLEQK